MGIAVGNEKIEKLKAAIEKGAVEIAQLTARIDELDEDVGRWEKDKVAATEVREKEAVDFTESLDALAGAIAVLKKQSHDRSQAELFQSLLQVKQSKLVPASAKNALISFLQQPVADSVPDAMTDDRLHYDAPEAYGYSFQSGGVVDMLVKLQNDFKREKANLEESELKAQHAFE